MKSSKPTTVDRSKADLTAAPKANATANTTQRLGQRAEDQALAHLLQAGLKLVTRNYRTPGRGGGEIDLIMHDRDGTLVFVEVRMRRSNSHGGAAASVGSVKQRRLIFAAKHYLMKLSSWPPCRFDVVAVEADRIEWLPGAFDAA